MNETHGNDEAQGQGLERGLGLELPVLQQRDGITFLWLPVADPVCAGYGIAAFETGFAKGTCVSIGMSDGEVVAALACLWAAVHRLLPDGSWSPVTPQEPVWAPGQRVDPWRVYAALAQARDGWARVFLQVPPTERDGSGEYQATLLRYVVEETVGVLEGLVKASLDVLCQEQGLGRGEVLPVLRAWVAEMQRRTCA